LEDLLFKPDLLILDFDESVKRREA